ncbi:unnamed protein product [Cylindrotheca closterium]|uniref:Uncharacterized protein n=1 Tax=Cylindrotheca closterium TaxID=2856 RepID=A0AAD2FKR8_9STRA|nr:unnamed protein product [Cylindrotheca closterium]
MQTASKLVVPKSFVLPRRLGTPSKLTYDSSSRPHQSMHQLESIDIKGKKGTKKRGFDPSVSIFRARTAGSLFDHDSTDASDEEDDLFTLRMANPICDSSDDESEEGSSYQRPPLKNELHTLMWSSRLEEDDIKGFSLGGLLLI